MLFCMEALTADVIFPALSLPLSQQYSNSGGSAILEPGVKTHGAELIHPKMDRCYDLL